MSNGSSFHNGDENLELQKRNRLGIYDEQLSGEIPASESAPFLENTTPPEDTATHEADSASPAIPRPPKAKPMDKDPSLLAPHERPYVSIYAPHGITYPGGKPTPEPILPPPEKRTYTNIYARRVAERPTETERGVYSNTPVSTENIPSKTTTFENITSDGIPYYEDLPEKNARKASVAYDTEDYADESTQYDRKNKLNVAALILGIASFAANLCCLSLFTPITAILAIVFGCKGRLAGKFEQKGLVGFVLGIVYLGLLLLVILFIVLIALISVLGEANIS